MSEFYKNSARDEYWRLRYQELVQVFDEKVDRAWEHGYAGGYVDGLTQAKEEMTQSLDSIFQESYEIGYEDGKEGYLRRWDSETKGRWRDYIYARYGPQLSGEDWDGENLEGI